MSSIAWLHLTDLHFGQGGLRWLWPDVRDEFENDLELLAEKTGLWDLVLFTGDLTQQGTPAQYDALTVELESLWSLFAQIGCDPVLLAVPGNHDLMWPTPVPPTVRALRQWHEDAELQAEFWSDAKSGYRQVIETAFSPFVAWLGQWRQRHPLPNWVQAVDGALPGDFSVTVSKPAGGGDEQSPCIGIAGLNSAFLQLTAGDYMGRLETDVRQLHAVCGGSPGRWSRRHQLAMLMTHHPPEWLHPGALTRFRSTVAPPGRFSMHLYGHMHEPTARSMQIAGSSTQLHIQGASLFGLESWGKDAQARIHGYSAARVEVDSEGERAMLHVWPRLLKTVASTGAYQLVPDFDNFTLDRNALDWRNTSLVVRKALRSGVDPQNTPLSVASPSAETGAPPPQAPGAPYDSRWYVERDPHDAQTLAMLRNPGTAVVVQAPELSGKSQFIRHAIRQLDRVLQAESVCLRSIVVDMGQWELATVVDVEALFREFARLLLAACRRADGGGYDGVGVVNDVDAELDAIWRRPSTLRMKVGRVMERFVLADPGHLVLLVIDRADPVVGRPTEQSFFGMLRSWADAAGRPPWSRLRMLLALSTTPLFLRNSGPTSDFFNRSVHVELPDLTSDQAARMAERYRLGWGDREIERITQLVGGHPFLLSLVMFHAATGTPTERLMDRRYLSENVLLAHLNQRWLWVQQNDRLLENVRQVTAPSGDPLSYEDWERLRMAGLVRRDANGYRLRNSLYESYFGKRVRSSSAAARSAIASADRGPTGPTPTDPTTPTPK